MKLHTRLPVKRSFTEVSSLPYHAVPVKRFLAPRERICPLLMRPDS